jgi:hypothetical protein
MRGSPKELFNMHCIFIYINLCRWYIYCKVKNKIFMILLCSSILLQIKPSIIIISFVLKKYIYNFLHLCFSITYKTFGIL